MNTRLETQRKVHVYFDPDIKSRVQEEQRPADDYYPRQKDPDCGAGSA
jgi:hypothetical protein